MDAGEAEKNSAAGKAEAVEAAEAPADTAAMTKAQHKAPEAPKAQSGRNAPADQHAAGPKPQRKAAAARRATVKAAKRAAGAPAQKAPPVAIAFRLFGKWPAVEVREKGLAGYINMAPRLLPRSEGAARGKFHKSRSHIVERLALKLMVSGHTGKRHRLTSGRFAGNYSNVLGAVERALDIIEQREKKNPLEVLVAAIENAALREEVISYQLGSIMAREAVVTAPQRRVDKTLRFFAQSAYRRAFRKKKTLGEALAEELIAAYRNSADSFAIKEKERIEREAAGAR